MAHEVDASKLTDADAKAVDVSKPEPIMINLALDGKTSAYSVGDLTKIAATASNRITRLIIRFFGEIPWVSFSRRCPEANSCNAAVLFFWKW